MVDAFGDVQDVKRLCEFCGARVRVPCNASRRMLVAIEPATAEHSLAYK